MMTHPQMIIEHHVLTLGASMCMINGHHDCGLDKCVTCQETYRIRKSEDRKPGYIHKGPFQSLIVCYLGIYHRKSILSFCTLHLKEICIPDKCVCWNVHTI